MKNLFQALEMLNLLIVAGAEFPDACYQVSCEQQVDYSDLADAYDAQFSGSEA